jgi:hypothetical protein
VRRPRLELGHQGGHRLIDHALATVLEAQSYDGTVSRDRPGGDQGDSAFGKLTV